MRLAAVLLAGLVVSGCIHVKVRETAEAKFLRPAELVCTPPAAGGAAITATPVASQAIADAPGKTLTAVRLDVPAGATSNPHQHAGLVFVYVLEGAVCSQVTGEPAPKAFFAGDTFFEPPGSQHLGFFNASGAPAKVLVTFVADTGVALTRPLQ